MDKTNLVLVLSDEHSRGFMGCSGHPFIRTPNMDRLARQGARFQAAYCTSPLCCPSRAGIMTGRYAYQTGYWDNIFAYDGKVKSWAHEGMNELMPMHIVDGTGDLLGLIRDEIPQMSKFKSYITDAGPGYSTYTEYDRHITETAVEWLEASSRKSYEKPWVLVVSLVAPHMPFVAPSQFYDWYEQYVASMDTMTNYGGDSEEHPYVKRLKRYLGIEGGFSEAETRKVIAAYCGLISYLDHNLGRIMDTLERTGLSSNTRIVYTSDHGECMGQRGLWGKSTLSEESAGVPLLFSGPDIVPGSVCDRPVSLIDLYPTMLEATVGKENLAPSDLPGISMFDSMYNEDRQREVVSEYHGGGSMNGCYMIRKGKFKYIHHLEEECELYDLAQDPYELRNVIWKSDYFEVSCMMRQALLDLLDPEQVNTLAKNDQFRRLQEHGGKEQILRRGSFGYTPAPGEKVEYK
jgi:choline-sulfatase